MTSLLWITISCAVNPPNVPLCTEINPTKGYCVYTMSGKDFEVSEKDLHQGKSWWEIRPYMIFMPIQSWMELKKFILKVCKTSKRCKNKHVKHWKNTVNLIDKNMMKE